MQQGFEPAPKFRVAKDQAAQGAAIELSIGLQHGIAKVFGDFRQRRAPGLYHPACRMVGVHHMNTQGGEVLGSGAFTTANAAGQAEDPGSGR